MRSEDHPSLSKVPNLKSSAISIDWQKCAICQIEKSEKLICPLNTVQAEKGAGYTTLARDLLGFQEIGALPTHLCLLTDDDALLKNQARWHRTCRAKYDKGKLARKIESSNKKDRLDDCEQRACTRSSLKISKDCVPTCFFCEEPAKKYGSKLRSASTKDIDFRVRNAATMKKDLRILTKLAAGDMIAIEAKYHINCLTAYNNEVRPLREENPEAKLSQQLQGIAFAELVAYMEESREVNGTDAFQLAELSELYSNRLVQLGAKSDSNRVHSTRLKERLLKAMPDLTAHNQGKHVLLSYKEDVANLLQNSLDKDDDALHIMRAAKAIRAEFLNKVNDFDGTFGTNCQKVSVPASLVALIRMLLDGASIKDVDVNDAYQLAWAVEVCSFAILSCHEWL
jgi:hypothetical protein